LARNRGIQDETFEWIPADPGLAMRASRSRRQLRASGRLIPDNDILIAASACERGVP